MKEINGVIEAISTKPKNGKSHYGIRIGEVWYNGFGAVKASKGDRVTVQYEETNFGNQVKAITQQAEEEQEQQGGDGVLGNDEILAEAKRLTVELLKAVSSPTREETISTLHLYVRELHTDRRGAMANRRR